ncbi:MAG: YigZ family protein [Epsilonproteobacteria bacterium]|nr:MAG: YigZ family protein [Campylobacterota bacterium]
MKYVKDTFTQILEIKQSKFIAYLTSYSNYDKTLATLKLQHPKARHFVVAYRYLNDYLQVVEHSSDDGEPKGTSGKPSLMVLQGNELINSAVIIVRYFGGTKLGTGGLVRAYSDAVNLVISRANLNEYIKEKEVKIRINYSDVRMIEYECELNKIDIYSKVFESDVFYFLRGSESVIDSFLEKVDRVILSTVNSTS